MVTLAGGAYLLLAGFFVDQVGVISRIIVLLPGVLLSLSGFSWSRYAIKKREDQRQERIGSITESLDALEERFEEFDMEDLVDSFAHRVVPRGSWRLNLYELDGKHWRRVARRSANPIYESGGRQVLSIAESMLKRVLERGLRDDSPVIDITGEFPDPETDLQSWVDAQVEWQLPASTAQTVRFRARRYGLACARLEGARGRVVALVLEVLDPADLDAARFERLVSRDMLTLLGKIFEAQAVVSASKAEVERLKTLVLSK